MKVLETQNPCKNNNHNRVVYTFVGDYINPLTTDDTLALSDFDHILSVGTIRFKDRFCTSKKGGIGGGGQAWS